MRIVIRPRRAGKTEEAIRESAKAGAYMVVINREEAARVFSEAQKMGLNIPFPLCFEEVRMGLYGPGCKSFVVDNADLILEMLLRRPVKMITLTAEDLSIKESF